MQPRGGGGDVQGCHAALPGAFSLLSSPSHPNLIPGSLDWLHNGGEEEEGALPVHVSVQNASKSYRVQGWKRNIDSSPWN